MCRQFVQRRQAFRSLKKLKIRLPDDEPDAWRGMRAALQASCGGEGDDVLPLVERLDIQHFGSEDKVLEFLEVLGQGALPALRHLRFADESQLTAAEGFMNEGLLPTPP